MRTILFRGVVAVAVSVCGIGGAGPGAERGARQGERRAGQAGSGRHDPLRGDGREPQDQTKTDKNGDFLQVGLASGGYKVTASKDKVGTQTLKLQRAAGPEQSR